MKPLFVVTNKENALFLKKSLENEIDALIALKEKDNKFYVYIEEEKIIETLVKSHKIYEGNKQLRNDTYWIDTNGIEMPLNLLPLYYAKLPKGRILSSNEYPIDINLFIQGIINCFKAPNHSVEAKYNKEDNSISFYIESQYYNQEVAKYLIENYVRYVGFEKIYLYDVYGNILGKTDALKKEQTSNMITFFKKSLFINALYNPLGNNIVPKNYIKNKKHDGFIISEHNISVRDFNIRTIRGNKTICWKDKIYGTFTLDESKTFDKYYDSYSGHIIPIDKTNFNMIDDAEFITTIQKINSYYDGIDVITEIKLVRNCLGYDFEEHCIRDGLFSDTPHHDIRSYIVLKEYFRIIGKNQLLHYSSTGNAFEIYLLPDNWKIENGLENIADPIIFTSLNDLQKDYENYEIIKELTETKEDNYLKKKKA